jgi:hypothetical protein
MKSGEFNMPPGVSTRDIPGNEPVSMEEPRYADSMARLDELTAPEHKHECADRKDAICGARGFCRCECGAIRRWFNSERLYGPNERASFDARPWEEAPKLCELCGEEIHHSAEFDPREQHGYGECVEMPDNFMSDFFDEQRHRKVALAPRGLFDPELGCVRGWQRQRTLPWWVYQRPYDQMRARGVAAVLLGWEMHVLLGDYLEASWDTDASGAEVASRMLPEFRGRRPFVCPVPSALRYAWMRSKAYAFANGYYSAEVINQREQGLNESFYARLTIPKYELLKWAILDGDGFDDENPFGGDYILACRLAMELTADRYNYPRWALSF